MAMKDMALTAKEAKEQYGPCCADDGDENAPKYPYGLSICLGNEALDKLGVGLMPVGTELLITSRAVVTGTSSRQRQSGENSQDMDVQITALEVASVQGDRMEASAKKLYPSKET